MTSPADFVGAIRGATLAGVSAAKALQRAVGAEPDGAIGPKTMAALAEFVAQHSPEDAPTNPGTPDAKASAVERRAAIVACAASYVGDCDPIVKVWPFVCPELAQARYRHDKSWCGGFALRVWQRSLPKCAGWKWDASGGKNGGFLAPNGVRSVSLPEPGDIAVWPMLNGKPVNHYAIVEFVSDGFVHTIDGNVTIAPSERVERRDRSIAHTDPTFYSAAAYL